MRLLYKACMTENRIQVGTVVLRAQRLVAYLTKQRAQSCLLPDMMDRAKVLVMTFPHSGMRHMAHPPL